MPSVTLICLPFAGSGASFFKKWQTAAPAGWQAMHRAARNLGTRGLVMQALSAVDIAWWDLKARLLEVSLVDLFGAVREHVPIYGSGGFTNLSRDHLGDALAHTIAEALVLGLDQGDHWSGDDELLCAAAEQEVADAVKSGFGIDREVHT